MSYLGLVRAGLWRKPARTLYTMASIIVAFLLFGLLQGINQGFGSALAYVDIDRLYVSARSNMTDGLPIAQLERIRTVPGVRAVSLWVYFGGYYQDARQPIPAFATDPEPLFDVYRELKVKPEYVQAMARTRTGVLISEELSRKHGWQIGDRIMLGTSIWTNKSGSNAWPFDVVGTFDQSAYGAGFPGFYLNYSYFDEARAFGSGNVHYYLVGVSDPNQAEQVARDIDALFANSPDETRTQTESALAQSQLKQLGDINFIVNAIVGAVLFTLLFLTANTMMQSVRERTSELAVLKTLGFSDTRVMLLVLLESLVLCVFAGAVGLALAVMAFEGGMLRQLFGDFSMPPVVMAMGAVLALVVALVSGLPPAWRASRLNIVDALAGR